MENEKLTPETEPETSPDIEDSIAEDIVPHDEDAASPDDAANDDDEAEPVAEAVLDEPEYDSDPDLDIDAALAAVASLGDFLTEQDEPEVEQQVQTAEFTAVDVAPLPAPQPRPRLFPAPPPSTLQRGSMASVVPALILIGIGAWLTFTLSTTGRPDTLLLVAVALGSIAVTLLSRWLSAGRWARGTLFVVSTLLLCALVLAGIALTGAAQMYPLLLVAVGVAFWMSAQFARPRDSRLMLPGSLLVIGGVVGTVVSTGVLGADLMNLAASLWYIPVIVIAILWLLPILFRGR